MQKYPLISVIIPIYNTENYLVRCLNSIINTGYENLEIICVNDGSPDNSINILQEYKNIDSRVIVLDVPNGGLSKSRNLGLDIARGDFICFIDSDDWIHRQFFDIMLSNINKTGADIGVCEFTRTNRISSDEYIDASQIKTSVFECGTGLDNHTVKSHVWGRLIRMSVINSKRFQVGIQTAEDTLFNLEVYADNPDLKTVLIETSMYYYYYREGSIINTDQGVDFIKFSYIYLQSAENSDNDRTVSIFLNEAFKNTFSVRYATMFESNMAIKNEVNQLTKRCLSLEKEKKPFPRKKAILLKLFAYFPNLYRWFRIMNDPTMLAWEKSKKKDLKRQK